MNQQYQTTADELRKHLPPHTHIHACNQDTTAAWTTTAGLWRVKLMPDRDSCLVAIYGPRETLACFTSTNAGPLLATLRLHGAIPAAPDPSATIRQLAQELTDIDSHLVAAGIDHDRGAKGVAHLSAVYRANRRLLDRATELLAENSDDGAFPDHTWRRRVREWLAQLSEPLRVDAAYDNAAQPVVHEDADPGRPAGMGPTALCGARSRYHPAVRCNHPAEHGPIEAHGQTFDHGHIGSGIRWLGTENLVNELSQSATRADRLTYPINLTYESAAPVDDLNPTETAR